MCALLDHLGIHIHIEAAGDAMDAEGALFLTGREDAPDPECPRVEDHA